MFSSVLGAALFIALLTGCSGDSRVSKVSGTITLDSEPVADAAVAFMPQEGGRPAFGLTDAEGNYVLSTFGYGDGALLGLHSVTVTKVDEQPSEKLAQLEEEHGSLAEVMAPTAIAKQVWLVPEKYSDAETSELEFDVVRGSNQADFSLSDKTKAVTKAMKK